MRYLITYQLEDEAPEKKYIFARSGTEITKLKKEILDEQISYGLEEDEAREVVEGLSILDVEELK